MNPTRTGRRSIAILVLIVLVATGLRFYRLSGASMWADEIMSLQQSTGRAAARFDPPFDRIHARGEDLTALADARPIGAIRDAMRSDTHPPLYLLLLRGWRTVFGESDAAARAMSAIWSLVAVMLMFDVARLLHGTSSGLWAAAIMAVATSQIQFAQETRAYAMLVALTLLCCDALVRIEIFGPSLSRLLVLSTSILATVMTHYLALPIALAIAGYVLLRLRDTARRRSIAAIVLAAIAFCLIWGRIFLQQQPNFTSNLGWVADDPNRIVLRTLQRVATLPLRLLVVPMKRWESLAMASALLYPLAIGALLIGKRKDLLLWCVLLAAIVGIAAWTDLRHHRRTLEQMRYTLVAGPAIYALGAALLARSPSRWLRHVVPASLVLACFLSIEEAHRYDWKPDLRYFAGTFNDDVGADDLVVVPVFAPDDWYHVVLYSAITHYAPPEKKHRPLLVLTGPPSPHLRQVLRLLGRVWIISGDESPAALGLFPGGKSADFHGTPYVGFYQRIILP